jgi:hypothetical protein
MQNMEILMYQSVLLGVGATVFMDFWSILQKRLLGIPSLNFALVGRWIGHMAKGQFKHNSIAAAPNCAGEAAIGWSVHYAIGVIFAVMLLLAAGPQWLESPTLFPALLIGLLTVTAPFLIMQPAFGFGIAASRTPNPNWARLKSIVTHLSFGLGLYVSAMTLRAFEVIFAA